MHPHRPYTMFLIDRTHIVTSGVSRRNPRPCSTIQTSFASCSTPLVHKPERDGIHPPSILCWCVMLCFRSNPSCSAITFVRRAPTTDRGCRFRCSARARRPSARAPSTIPGGCASVPSRSPSSAARLPLRPRRQTTPTPARSGHHRSQTDQRRPDYTVRRPALWGGRGSRRRT